MAVTSTLGGGTWRGVRSAMNRGFRRSIWSNVRSKCLRHTLSTSDCTVGSHWWAGSASSTWKTRFYSHLHTWSNHATDHLLLGKLFGRSRSMSVRLVSVSQSHSRPTSLSSTVLCLKISSSSVHIRSYWHNNVCNAFFWKISSIHRLLDQIGCDSVFYLIAKCSRSIAEAVYMSPDLYSESTYTNVFAGSSLRALLPKQPLLPHLDVGLSIFSWSTLSAGFPICNPYYFMII